MNYDFLKNYNIPIVQQNTGDQYVSSSYSIMDGAYGTYSMQSTQNVPTVDTAFYGYGGCNTYNSGYRSGPEPAGNSFDRFIPPSKHGTDYIPHKTLKRKHSAVGGVTALKKQSNIAEVTNDGKLVIFLGRDESYPDELNALIHPLSCNLCDIKMNSRAIAKDHYESKVHDKHISSWLFKNYTEKGITPPEIKRLIKQGSTGPDAYYCKFCDLKLTSLAHANQHFAGKKHRSVIAQRTKPSGMGFYNSEGNWVRTSITNPSKNLNFGIGESFRLAEIIASTTSLNTAGSSGTVATGLVTNVADTTTTIGNEVKSNGVNTNKKLLTTNSELDPALFCSICKVSVTAAAQMTMHMSGSKHLKKLKLVGLKSTPSSNNSETQKDVVPPAAIVDNVLLSAIKEETKPDPSDLSMYRTPSGQYYCKTCNTSMSHLPALEQHLKGKRHLRKQSEEKAMAPLTSNKK